MEHSSCFGTSTEKAEDWPAMLWTVFSQPPGMAVIEILQASRSDPELAALVGPTQERVEQLSIEGIMRQFPGNEQHMRATVRLFVWATRGLALSRVLSRDSSETEQAVRLFQHMVAQSVRAGRMTYPDD